MPVIIRAGRHVRFEQPGPKDGPKPGQRPPCDYCGKPRHDFAAKWGSHLGNSWLLREAILGGGEIEEHPWFIGGYSLAAHHLICSEAMADDEDWARFCRQFGYDINRKENGVMLPSRLESACELHVAVHRGNHNEGWAEDLQLAYPKAVKALLEKIAEQAESGAFCTAPEGLVRKLDQVSARILDKVARFSWTLTRDGHDYQKGGQGCAGVKSIAGKPKRRCPHERRHALQQAKTGAALPRRELVVGA